MTAQHARIEDRPHPTNPKRKCPLAAPVEVGRQARPASWGVVVRAGGLSLPGPGAFLASSTHGHSRELAAAARVHLLHLVGRIKPLPGISTRAFVDIDSLVRPVYGHHKQAASFGHTKIAEKQVLRKGPSPLAAATTAKARRSWPGSGCGPGKRPRQAWSLDGGRRRRTARGIGAASEILVRGDSAYGNAGVVSACLSAGGYVLGGVGQESGSATSHRLHPRSCLGSREVSRPGYRPPHRPADLGPPRKPVQGMLGPFPEVAQVMAAGHDRLDVARRRASFRFTEG